MSIAPLVIPARPETTYDQLRVSGLSITQRGVGQPLVISYQIDRYRVVNGVPEDAPAGTVSGNVQKGMAAMLASPEMAQAIVTINEWAVAEAVAAGLLTVTE